MKSASSLLTVRTVPRTELDRIQTPATTATWFPVGHSTAVDTAVGALERAGFNVTATKFTLARSDARLLATMDLATEVCNGVRVVVAIRNSIDKSLPLGFLRGFRVGSHGGLIFSSDTSVRKKHTRNAQGRFQDEIDSGVRSLLEFRETESQRIEQMRAASITDTTAESLMLRAYEQRIISPRLLPKLIRQWRDPLEEFRSQTLWSLLNAFLITLSPIERTNPQRLVNQVLALGPLFAREDEGSVHGS